MSRTRNIGTSAGAQYETGTITGEKTTPSATAESKAWKGAVLQIAREGRAIDLITLLSDLEASGDIAREPDETDINPDDLEKADALDAEIELSDEDDPHLSGWDDEVENFRDPTFALQKGLHAGGEANHLPPIKIELLITDGRCYVHRPAWMRARPLTDSGQELLDEIGLRFEVLDTVGTWLSQRRKEFLHTPDPWLLGVEALGEMRRGYASVSQGSFLKLTGLGKVVLPETFSRHTTDCLLVWEDGSLPLDFIFGREARMAWVANAVAQWAGAQTYPLTQSVLDRFQGITVPRRAEERNQLLHKQVDNLEFGEFISKANLMGDTKWAEVVACYTKRLLEINQ